MGHTQASAALTFHLLILSNPVSSSVAESSQNLHTLGSVFPPILQPYCKEEAMKSRPSSRAPQLDFPKANASKWARGESN